VMLYHVGNLIQFFAFLLRDQLNLRTAMFVGIFLQGVYHILEPGGPNMVPLFWKIVFSITNILMIFWLYRDRFDFGIAADLRGLFEKMKVLTPGDFRKLIKTATRSSNTAEPLLVEGHVPDSLYFLLKGEAVLRKGNSEHTLESGIFLGEIAFLNKVAASATVTLKPGAECVCWNAEGLHALLGDNRALNIAMRGVFNSDLAAKLASSMPLPKGV
jgi:hypothetical protein